MQHSARTKAAWIAIAGIAVGAIMLGSGALGWLWRADDERGSTATSAALSPAAAVQRRIGSEAAGSSAPSTPTSSSARRARQGEGPVLDRARADALRARAARLEMAEQRTAEQRTAEQRTAESAAGTSESSHPSAGEPPAMTPEEEQRRRDFIRQAVREQYFPIARSCYQELLDREPRAGGKVVMSFAIAGVGDAGVVDRVELLDDSTLDDPEFTQCMRESMYSTVFEPPPRGSAETTVVYPVELRPE
jgi:hypothetical protein